jgi:ABC-type phosphate transport system permease subunit
VPLLCAASTLMLLPLVNADDETKAIADNKIAVVLIVFHMFIWTFLLFLLLLLFVNAIPAVQVFKNNFSNCYPNLIQIEPRSWMSNNAKME